MIQIGRQWGAERDPGRFERDDPHAHLLGNGDVPVKVSLHYLRVGWRRVPSGN